MKKMFLLLVVALTAVTNVFAQSSMLATLSHEGQISTFYGTTALRDAYNAAVHGDIITLSSGTFLSIDIQKAVTIRGAGMGIDASAKVEPTVITGDLKLNIPEDVTERLTIEGIYSNHYIYYDGNLKNATFIKNRFKEFSYSSNGRLTNATFVHCRIADGMNLNNNSSASFINSIIWDLYVSSSSASAECLNCVIKMSDVHNSSLRNCVLLTSNAYYEVPSTCIAYNCVGVGSSYFFDNMPNQTNVVKSYAEVFKTLTSTTYSDSENFELTDDAKASFLGIDGTQVGIYGGNMPYSSTPTNPQITKCNVAAKSTADGKLSVDITVGGAE